MWGEGIGTVVSCTCGVGVLVLHMWSTHLCIHVPETLAPHTYTHAHIHTYTHTHIHTYTHTHIHTCNMCTDTHVTCMHNTYPHIFVNMCRLFTDTLYALTCMYHMHTPSCTHICISIPYTRTHTFALCSISQVMVCLN